MDYITPLPSPPSRSRPASFEAEADAFLTALIPFGNEVNVLADQMQLFSSANVTRGYFSSQEGQDTFVVPLGYVPGSIDVYQNGIKLRNGIDIDVSDGATIVFTEPLAEGHEIDYTKYASFPSITVYNQQETNDLVDEKLTLHSQEDAPHVGHATVQALNNHISNVSPHSGHVVITTQINAGNGLSGGGPLNSNRFIHMGTPGDVTRETPSSVTETSHTHALDYEPNTEEVLSALSELNPGSVGSMAFLSRITGLPSITLGEVVSGSTLKYASIVDEGGGAIALNLSTDSPEGQWKCLGFGGACLYLRVS